MSSFGALFKIVALAIPFENFDQFVHTYIVSSFPAHLHLFFLKEGDTPIRFYTYTPPSLPSSFRPPRLPQSTGIFLKGFPYASLNTTASGGNRGDFLCTPSPFPASAAASV